LLKIPGPQKAGIQGSRLAWLAVKAKKLVRDNHSQQRGFLFLENAVGDDPAISLRSDDRRRPATRITARMQTYGDMQAAYLSDAYWQQLEARLERCGSAQDILTLEYHGIPIICMTADTA